jgi:carbonic anhydrase
MPVNAIDFPELQACLTSNAEWAARVSKDEPHFFEKSAQGQKPFLLWIGCEQAKKSLLRSQDFDGITLWANIIRCFFALHFFALTSHFNSHAGADSRVPESVVLGRKPGEIFVHRNIANQYQAGDDSAQAVLEYAVGFLGVRHGEFFSGFEF